MKQYVVIWISEKKNTPTVYGNRYGRPFDTEVNAQRSLTRRRGKGKKKDWWFIQEISK